MCIFMQMQSLLLMWAWHSAYTTSTDKYSLKMHGKCVCVCVNMWVYGVCVSSGVTDSAALGCFCLCLCRVRVSLCRIRLMPQEVVDSMNPARRSGSLIPHRADVKVARFGQNNAEGQKCKVRASISRCAMMAVKASHYLSVRFVCILKRVGERSAAGRSSSKTSEAETTTLIFLWPRVCIPLLLCRSLCTKSFYKLKSWTIYKEERKNVSIQ